MRLFSALYPDFLLNRGIAHAFCKILSLFTKWVFLTERNCAVSSIHFMGAGYKSTKKRIYCHACKLYLPANQEISLLALLFDKPALQQTKKFRCQHHHSFTKPKNRVSRKFSLRIYPVLIFMLFPLHTHKSNTHYLVETLQNFLFLLS